MFIYVFRFKRVFVVMEKFASVFVCINCILNKLCVLYTYIQFTAECFTLLILFHYTCPFNKIASLERVQEHSLTFRIRRCLCGLLVS